MSVFHAWVGGGLMIKNTLLNLQFNDRHLLMAWTTCLTWRLTCWSDQRVVQSGQGGGLLLSQPHPDLLPDPPGFGHRVRRRAVRGDHIRGAGGVGLQSGQETALRHRYTHPQAGEKRAHQGKDRKMGQTVAGAARQVTNGSVWVSAAKWRSVSSLTVCRRDLQSWGRPKST